MSTADSVDRVFSHALATVRRLPRTGSSRPPPSARLRLYGLYKQSMEGDVSAILPRPVLPLPPSPPPQDLVASVPSISSTLEDTSPPTAEGGVASGVVTGSTTRPGGGGGGLQHRDSSQSQHNTVHRYASRDLRTREAQAEIEKWDAWHACAGMTRTEAKRKYIEALIATMKEYASGTSESRELVGELEFVWGQIRNSSQVSGGGGGSSGSGSGASGRGSGAKRAAKGSEEEDGDGESPRRSGLQGLAGGLSSSEVTSSRKSRGSGGVSGSGSGPSHGSKTRTRLTTRREELAKDGGRLRVLSPMSPREGSDVVEGRDVDQLDEDAVADEDEDEDEEGALQHRRPSSTAAGGPSNGGLAARLATLEAQLRRLSTEIAALREQLSANHMLSSSSYSPYTHQQLSLRWKVWYRVLSWVRWTLVLATRQVCFASVLLAVMVAWGRWKGDGRAEEWARRRWKEMKLVLGQWWDGGAWLAGMLSMRSLIGSH